MNGRKRKNLISSLVINGEEVENFDVVSNEATRYYMELYAKENVERLVIVNLVENRISGDMKEELEWPFSMEEV